MLTKDETKIKQHQVAQHIEQVGEAKRRELIEDMKRNTVTVEDDAGRDVSSIQAQLGRPMTAETVMAKLKKCNSKLHFERARNFPSLMGIYLLQGESKAHICGMEAGVMPEFSVLHKAKRRVPDTALLGHKKPTREVAWKEIDTFASETRGWRTVLLRLLHAGYITRGDVELHFGWAPSHDSRKWKEQTT